MSDAQSISVFRKKTPVLQSAIYVHVRGRMLDVGDGKGATISAVKTTQHSTIRIKRQQKAHPVRYTYQLKYTQATLLKEGRQGFILHFSRRVFELDPEILHTCS